MSVDLKLLRAGIARNLGSIRGVHVSPYEIGSPNPPVIHVMTAEMNYDLAGTLGLHMQVFTVQALFSSADMETSQRALDPLVADSGTGSVKGAVESDTTLGGVCADLRVTSCTGQRRYIRENGAPLIGAEWTVEVYI
jgi:hypothetical protein